MRLGAAAVIIEALMQIDPQFPTAIAEALADMEAAKAELLAEGPLREGVIIPGINDGPPADGAEVAAGAEDAGRRPRRSRRRARRRADRVGQPLDRRVEGPGAFAARSGPRQPVEHRRDRAAGRLQVAFVMPATFTRPPPTT